MRQIVLMILALSSWMLCAAEPESSLDSVLSYHRERVAVERKRIEERHANCIKCKGTSEVVDKDLCATCRGSGLISTRKGQATISKPCVTCSGKGLLESRSPCPRCCPYVVVESKTQEANQKPEVKASAPEKQKCTACSGAFRRDRNVASLLRWILCVCGMMDRTRRRYRSRVLG